MCKDKDQPAPVRIFLVAGETSGDALGAEIIEPLREKFGGNVEFFGIGGPAMAARGIDSPIHISQLSVLGYIEGLLAWRRIVKLAQSAALYADECSADIVILIDSWGFTLRVARAVRAIRPEALLVKYVGPQVWASRPGRAKTLGQAVDHLLTIHPFDAPYYETESLPITFVGNPVLSRYRPGDGAALRKSLNIAENAQILLVLFGSRSAEFSRLHEPFAEAVHRLRKRHPDLVVLCPLSRAIGTQVRAAATDDPRLQDMIFLDEEKNTDVFAAADLALACSGTVTTELAAARVPMVVGYKIGQLSWALLKTFFLKTRFVTLVNMASDKMIVPEFLQNNCQPGALYVALEQLLGNKKERDTQKKSLAVAIKKMTTDGSPTPQRVAGAIYSFWQKIKR